MKRIPIEDAFDLHSFRPRDVVSVVADYLAEARGAGFREVRLIHGKGTGARRAEVRRFLASRSDVADYFDAPPGRGGTGATIVVLAPPRNPRPPDAPSSRARSPAPATATVAPHTHDAEKPPSGETEARGTSRRRPSLTARSFDQRRTDPTSRSGASAYWIVT